MRLRMLLPLSALAGSVLVGGCANDDTPAVKRGDPIEFVVTFDEATSAAERQAFFDGFSAGSSSGGDRGYAIDFEDRRMTATFSDEGSADRFEAIARDAQVVDTVERE